VTVSFLVLALAVSIAPVRDSRARLATYAPSIRKPSRQIPWQLVAAFFAVSAAWVLGGLAAGCAAVALAGTLIFRGRRAKAAENRDLSQKMLLSGLEVLIAELSVGAHPAVASSVAGEECSGEVSAVFRSAGARARLGGSTAAAFAVPDSCIEREFSRIGSVWRVADQHGLALAELLGAVRTDMLGRRRFRQRTEAGLAGARATAAVLAFLPLLGIGLGQLMGASPLRVLFGGGLGGVLLVIGTACVSAGLLWTDRITAKVTS